MKTPPFLLGASLIFWGWQTGHLIIASAMALVLEGSRWFAVRWDFSASDYNRISDLCTLILIGMFIYLFFSIQSIFLILILLQWLPIAIFPLLIFQVYGTSEAIDISALFLMMRKKTDEGLGQTPVAINLTYPYFAACILSASAANVRNIGFYAGLMVLGAWALWFQRSRRFSSMIWLTLFVFAGIGGYGGQIGLRQLQLAVERKSLEWFSEYMRQDTDPYRSRTAIGDIGELKLSDRIVFRVRLEDELECPLLLREAGYNKYNEWGWFALPAKFETVLPDEKDVWKIQSRLTTGKGISISSYLRHGKGMLKLPNGAFQIENLPVMKMTRNQFGAFRVEEGPGFVDYRVLFNPSASLDSPPNIDDLSVPKTEVSTIFGIAKALDLKAIPRREALKRIDYYFREHFKYSLVLSQPDSDSTPLSHFLLKTRAGHCEYFATATVLLLRAARIPARYASGYSVQEFSRMENCFVVRARHAHAWALVHIDGNWRNFDTTPASWFNIEDESASILQPISDVWSWCMLKFSQWRWIKKEGGLKKYGIWVLVPLIVIFARKLYSQNRVKRIKIEKERVDDTRVNPGKDSEFYRVEKRLNEFGFYRESGETFSFWISNIEANRPSFLDLGEIRELLTLHYRYRFDPKGLTPGEKAALRSSVSSWLARNDALSELPPGKSRENGNRMHRKEDR
jgi:hypothetical protein